jgi:creatinine amidohydrolase/Fe(II)-dependent formamide hydrolase-like protein
VTTRSAAALLLLLLAVASPTWAAAPPSVYLEDLTWTELAAAIKAGKTTILIPLGGTEQSGPYMALGKHNARARLLAGRIAAALGDALVAPVLAYVPEGTVNPPTAHMRFPGTITIPDAVFESVLEYAARSFKLHGFKDIVFLGDHGGYQADETAVALRLNREWAATPVRVHALPVYYQVTETAYPEALRRRGHGAAEIGTHAGLADTSLTLALAPDLVRSAALADAPAPTAADGVAGDPRRATAALGQLGVDLILDRTVAAIRKAEARP